MKKYLMTGVAAIALCAAFTSCSSKDELYNPEQIRQNEIASVYDNYDKAFIQTFGQPAANQDWGFGSVAKTRTWNVNGNQWHDGVNYNYEYDAPVTTAEKNLVFNYVNDVNNVKTVDQISFTQYWVAQIWNGNTDQNADEVKAPVSHSYPNQNGAITDIIGGAQMDKLEILEFPDTWTHCNNFNHADNNDWIEPENGGVEGRTLMEKSGTLSFRYTNSQGSYLSEKYIIVPGEKIHSSLAGFYYVCFDFEKGYTDAEKAQETTYFSYKAKDNNGAEQAEQTVSLPGYYTSTNMPTDQQILAAINNPNYKSISSISIKGYLYGDKHCDGDDNYTDWIVRISPAKVKSSYDVRIIAEDLNAKANDSAPAKDGLEESDWDFNDVVFDIKFKDGDKADIHVVCVGGVLPLYVAGQEVHELCGQSKGTDGLYKILGTVDARVFEVSNVNRNNYKDNVKIEVGKVLSDGTTEIFELPAPVGKPAAKIAVKTSYVPCGERVDIRTQYHQFGLWITNSSVIWY